ncbi:MAG: sugar ABC transporter substrate-binding protein [Actinomycetota bacterium]|nr:sugar ABC transporter substrate-binding protein [Actinomycetota bacterium]
MSVSRTSTVSAFLAALALSVASCAGGDGGGTNRGTDPQTDAENSPASWEGETLDVWIMEGTNPDAEPFFDAVAKEFNAKTGATLDVQYIPWTAAHDKFVTSIAGDTGPDVAEVGTTWTPEFADAGALADLSERVEGSEVSGDLVEGLVTAGTADGALYGMPWYAGVRSIVYRADVFEDLGLEPPTTWDEWVEVGTAIKEAKPNMVAMPVIGESSYGVYPFIWGAGGEIATESDGTWTSQLDSPEARRGIEFYTGLATEHGLSTPAAVTWDELELRDAFIKGDVAMMMSGSWTPKAIVAENPELEGKLGAFTIPGPDGGHSPSFVGGSHLAVFESSDKQDLGWEFIELMSTQEYATKWAEQTTFFPGLESLLADLQQESDPLVAPFATQMVEAGRSVPVTPEWGQVEAKVTVPAMLQSILSGKKSVDDATADAAAEMNEVLGS